MKSMRIVKLQSRKVKVFKRKKGETVSIEETEHFLLTVPKDFIKELGWSKGDPLIVRIMEVTVNGSKRKALIYYRP